MLTVVEFLSVFYVIGTKFLKNFNQNICFKIYKQNLFLSELCYFIFLET